MANRSSGPGRYQDCAAKLMQAPDKAVNDFGAVAPVEVIAAEILVFDTRQAA